MEESEKKEDCAVSPGTFPAAFWIQREINLSIVAGVCVCCEDNPSAMPVLVSRFFKLRRI